MKYCIKSTYIDSKKFFSHSSLTPMIGISLVTGVNLFLLSIKSVYAESCTAFPVIGGEKENETEVTKTVSQPGLSIPVIGPAIVGINNNWNTDFSIIPLKQYKQYIITFTPKDDGEYKVRGYLKYNDNTADEIYNENKGYTAGKVVEIKGRNQGDNIPIQVNLFVGDPVSLGKTYTVSAKGCL